MTTDPSTPFFSTSEIDRIFSFANQMRQMARFECALTAALEEAGLAAEGSAKAIAEFPDAEFVSCDSLLIEARRAGNIAIPFVRQLTAVVRASNEDAAQSIHLGATSQDVLDTALVLQIREALGVIQRDVAELNRRLADQARAHAGTILLGRTWLQASPPITLGLKIAGWIAALRRHEKRLRAAGERAIVLQFGGAVGTLAALGEKGAQVSASLARKLELVEPEIPWHAHRDGLVDIAAAVGMLVGTLGKMARDISLMMQSEVGEVLEPATEGRGGSSTMPQKRNPVASAVILAAATRVPGLVATLMSAMVQEHERCLGNWQAEWEIVPEIFRLTAAALERAIEIAGGMQVCSERMVANLEATRGLAIAESVSIALAVKIGRENAHRLVEDASRRAIESGRHLRDVLMAMPEIRLHFDEAEIERLLDARNYLGSTQRFIDRVLGGGDGLR